MPAHPDRTRLLMAAYAVGVAVILLMPTAGLASWVVLRTSEALTTCGIPPSAALPVRVEFALNALMFAPLTFVGALHWRSVRWTEWVAWTFVASVAFEAWQGLLLSGRSAQHADVVANTAGGLLGVLVALAVVRLRARFQSRAPSRSDGS